MKNIKTLFKASALALLVAAAGAATVDAQCPSVYEYTRSDGVRRVCGLRSDSFMNFCLYNCFNAT